MEKSDLEKILFAITIFIIIVLIVWQYIVITNNIAVLQQNNNTTIANESENQLNGFSSAGGYAPEYASLSPPIRIASATRGYDYSAYLDPLTPPYRRDEYNTPMVGLPTRGYPSTYKKMGTLFSTDDTIPMTDPYKIMFLMGRETYPTSNSYEYYVVEKDSESGVLKFDLSCNKSTKLYNDDDIITIKELNRTYKVKMDKLDQFMYNPYLMW